jgi:hypothetical protein
MKKFIYFIITLWVAASVIFLGCQKDEMESESAASIPQTDISTADTLPHLVSRTQTLDKIFYRGSLTTDNYLVSSNRVYEIYNKSKVKEVRFNATGQPSINVAGVVLRHYNVQIVYKDLTTRQFTAFSKSTSTSFTYTPTGSNLLTDTHTAKFLELSQTNINNGYTYHLWRDVQIAPKSWDIKKDGVTLIATKSIEPIDKNSNIFIPQHIH